MIIGFDAKRLFHNYTGLGYYSRTLVNSLYEADDQFRAVLFDGRPVKNAMTAHYFEQDRIQIHALTKPAWYHRSINVNNAVRKYPIQVYHGLSNELPLVRLKAHLPSVVTVHDVLFKRFPQDFPLVDRAIYQLKTSKALDRATTVIAISEATKNELVHYFPNFTPKIKVVYQAYDPLFNQSKTSAETLALKLKYQLPEQYLLYVGSITHRKNLKIILNALVSMPEAQRRHLVVAGNGTGYLKLMHEYILAHKLESWIRFLPNLSRYELHTLYVGAEMLIYPSLGEGFGLPVLEGLAANIPVITSGVSSMPEAGGSLAVYFDPTRAEELADKINTVSKTAFQNIPAEVRTQHLQKFNASRIARQYLDDVYLPLQRGES